MNVIDGSPVACWEPLTLRDHRRVCTSPVNKIQVVVDGRQ